MYAFRNVREFYLTFWWGRLCLFIEVAVFISGFASILMFFHPHITSPGGRYCIMPRTVPGTQKMVNQYLWLQPTLFPGAQPCDLKVTYSSLPLITSLLCFWSQPSSVTWRMMGRSIWWFSTTCSWLMGGATGFSWDWAICREGPGP